MGLLQNLQEETKEIHKNLELLSFHRELKEQKLSSISIYSFLRCMTIIYMSLEKELIECPDEHVKTFWNLDLSKIPFLEKDLQIFGNEPKKVIGSAVDIAIDIAHRITLESKSNPLFLLGILYVTEGSQNGGVYLKPLIAKCLDVSPDHIFYFGIYGTQTSAIWAKFTKNIDSLVLSSTEEKQVIEGAKYIFSSFDKLISALNPFIESDLRFHISTINPEAGSHAISQDPEEIKIAYLAGEKAWKRFPYLALRFGERGERFTHSDSCWLLTLYSLELELIRKNIFWLKNLLSARGLPSIILEVHLNEIYEGLLGKWTHRQSEFVNLKMVITELNEMRLRQIGNKKWDVLCKKYDKLLQMDFDYKDLGVTELMLSAWADEQNGIPNAYIVVEHWFKDPNRFSKEWISTIENLTGEIQETNQ